MRRKKIFKRMRDILIILGIVLSLSGYIFFVRPLFKENDRVAGLPIGSIDLNMVADGVYTGAYSYARRNVVVELEVIAHAIVRLDVLEKNDSKQADDAALCIKKSIIQLQRTDVDAVSGATTNSKAILKAVENALRKNTD